MRKDKPVKGLPVFIRWRGMMIIGSWEKTACVKASGARIQILNHNLLSVTQSKLQCHNLSVISSLKFQLLYYDRERNHIPGDKQVLLLVSHKFQN
jgi:hypothetical protein